MLSLSLASLKRRISWWSGYHYRWMWMCDIYIVLLQQWLQHKDTQHLHGRNWGRCAWRAPQHNFWAGYLYLWPVQTGLSVFSSWGNTFIVAVLLTDHARRLKPSSVTPIHVSSTSIWYVINSFALCQWHQQSSLSQNSMKKKIQDLEQQLLACRADAAAGYMQGGGFRGGVLMFLPGFNVSARATSWIGHSNHSNNEFPGLGVTGWRDYSSKHLFPWERKPKGRGWELI